MSPVDQISATDAVRIGAKLYARNPEVVVADAYVPLFHGWIQRRGLDGVPIDVADYKHVPDGPGIMLIGHEADRSIDFGEGRPGVVYQRKRDLGGTLEERFVLALEAVDRTAADIEADPAAGGVVFERDEILVRSQRPAPRPQRRRHPGDRAPGARGGAPDGAPRPDGADRARDRGPQGTVHRPGDPHLTPVEGRRACGAPHPGG